jgi:hypothetical protein
MVFYNSKVKCKCALLLLAFTSFSLISVKGQDAGNEKGLHSSEHDVNRFQYTIVDKASKSFRSFWGAKSGEITFKLIELKNLDANKIIRGVEIDIRTQGTEYVSTSIAFANVSNLWGVSASSTFANIQNSGYMFLDTHDIELVADFINRIIVETGKSQDKFTIYKISIRNQFEFGMLYNPESTDTNKWGFVFTANETTYQLNYTDGISLIRSLSKFHKYIKENQVE